MSEGGAADLPHSEQSLARNLTHVNRRVQDVSTCKILRGRKSGRAVDDVMQSIVAHDDAGDLALLYYLGAVYNRRRRIRP